MPRAYYNEIDPFAAAWLRKLIEVGAIAPGDVDERDIRDVRPSDLDGYTQVHAFAGIGVWSYALRRAGVSDSRRIWTGSCPCQGFSDAGQRLGFADERHLWPYWHHLIRVCRPPVVFSEQVASKGGLAWLDLVQADLEGTDYACGAVDTCVAGFGGPHIRQRQYLAAVALEVLADSDRLARDKGPQEPSWRDYRSDADEWRRFSDGGRSREPAHSDGGRREGARLPAQRGYRRDQSRAPWRGEAGELADADGGNPSAERQQRSGQQRLIEEDRRARGVADADDAERRSERAPGNDARGAPTGRQQGDSDAGKRSFFDPLADSIACGRARVSRLREEGTAERSVASLLGDPGGEGPQIGQVADERRGTVRVEGEAIGASGALCGFWSDAQWILCSDERWRAVESWSFPLVASAPACLVRLRGYGNALNAEQATEFVRSFFEAECTGFAPPSRTGHIEDLIG